MTDEPFPPAVRELAAARRLGDPVRAFRPRLVRMLVAVLVRRRDRPVPVYLFDGGLVRPPEAYGWAELSAVTAAGVRRRRRSGRTRWQVTIELADEPDEPDSGGIGRRRRRPKRSVRIADDVADMELLGDVIVAEVMRRVVPGYVAAVEQGGTVTFGPFTVSGKGIEKDAELIPWPAVGSVGMGNGVVYVRRVAETGPRNAVMPGGGVIAVIAARMPNAAAFIALCRYLGARVEDTTA